MPERSFFLFRWAFGTKIFVVTLAIEAINYGCVLRRKRSAIMAQSGLLANKAMSSG